MRFAVISAVDSERGIGKAGALPWRLKGDMEHFRVVTTSQYAEGRQNAVIMGRTTWLSLPEKFRPLPGRLNIILSSEPLELLENVVRAGSFDEALRAAEELQAGKVFVIGGGSVYAQAVERQECQELFLTHIKGTFGCDTFFPSLPTSFRQVSVSPEQIENGVAYSFAVYTRA